jgi:hypothetical protein
MIAPLWHGLFFTALARVMALLLVRSRCCQLKLSMADMLFLTGNCCRMGDFKWRIDYCLWWLCP